MPLHKDLAGTDLHAPGAHKTQHEDGGSDEISLTGLAGAPALGSATTAVTQTPADNSTKVATTAYADAAAAAATGTYTDEKAQDAIGAMVDATLTYVDAAPSLGVASSVALAGNPTTTTQSAGNNSTRIATTAFVTAAVADVLDGATFSGNIIVPDEAYDATAWNGSLEVPTKNAVRDKIEALGGGVSDGDKGDVTVSGSGATWTIDNNTVTLAKMADMNTNKLLGRSTASTGDPEEIAVGSGLVLSGGTLTANGATGGLVLLEQHTASASASLDFTSWYSSAYDEYIIEIVSLRNSTASNLQLVMSTSGGSSYDTTVGHYEWEATYVFSGTTGRIGSQLQGSLTFRDVNTTHASTGCTVGHIRLYDPANTSLHKMLLGQVMFNDSTAIIVAMHWGGLYKDTGAVNAFQFVPSAGNLASGTVRVYGVAK